jgi:hypothetical protein
MPNMTKRKLTIRRSLQQLKHCVDEAIAVVEAEEDVGHAMNDLEHAALLINKVLLPKLSMNMPADRGEG